MAEKDGETGDGKEGPKTLADLQAWFGQAISRPLPAEYQGNPLAAGSPHMREAGDALVKGAGGLSGFDRVGIYNQQYWFRLIGIMQGEYPCTVHLTGLKAFNAWAIRYLDAHPPSSPYLARLDDAWPDFLRNEYREADREAVLQAVDFDRAFSKAVDAPEGQPLSAPGGPVDQGVSAAAAAGPQGGGSAVDLMSLRVTLAPHASVLRLDWDFPAYRALCLADESLEASIELKPAESRLLIWRGVDGTLWQKPLSVAAWKVLLRLREPVTVPEAFERLEGALEEEERADLEANLSGWFGGWTRDGILVRAG